MGSMWNYWSEGKGANRKVRKARKRGGVHPSYETVGGVGLSDWIPGKYSMGQKEYGYRMRHAERLWSWYGDKGQYAGKTEGFPARGHGETHSHRTYPHGNLHGNTKDRRSCNHPGRKCDRCGHTADCSEECGRLKGRAKWTW